MNGDKATEILHKITYIMEDLHTLCTEETDPDTRTLLSSSLDSLEDSEDKLKKAYFAQVEKNLK